MAKERRNPYAAPDQPLTPPAARLDWRRTSLIACAWLLAASTLAAALAALRTGFALRDFDGQALMSPIAAIEAFRASGAQVAATAAALGAFAGAHDHLPRQGRWELPLATGAVFAAVPVATLVAACLMTAWTVVVASLGFDVPVERSWHELQQRLSVSDPPERSVRA
jgi:hypothetical protein